MSAQLASGSSLAGYVIERQIGAGGMGTVFLAREEALSRSVALKLLIPELAQDDAFRQRFLEETRLAASLEHPRICPVYGAGEADGTLYLALRYVEGEDAARLVEKGGPLAPERALVLLTDLAGALDHAHAHGLLHRDVKAENVLLDGNGNAYLADFGLARPLEQRGATSTRALEGTLLYLSPEQIEGRAASSASDEYAFACLAYFLLAGGPPFQRSHEAAILYAHLRDDVPSLAEPGLARLDPVFRQALAKRPEERYRSCAAFAAALSEALQHREPTTEGWPEGLPRPRTSFLGRQRELNELEATISEKARLVTLTGPGGTGKTRLALELALRLAPRYERGTVWVALAAISDPELVIPQIASAIGASERGLEDAIGGDGAFLLCLDNVEQLLPGAAAELSALLDRCPNVTMLCTSRSPVRVERELEYRVPPLAEVEAVELFAERASAHDESAAETDAAREICLRVDCLPLAIELASARLRLLSPQALLERLEQRLPILTGGLRDVPERQRTLSATLDWSYDLLGEAERELLASLSVFQGGFTLEAAEQVCDAELEALAGLLDASLVRRRGSAGGDARFDLLAVIHEYAAVKLDGTGDPDALHARHCDFYCAWAQRARSEAETAQELWSALMRDELPNIRAALSWSGRHGEPHRLARTVWKLGRFWHRLGLSREGGDWAERALAQLGDEPSEERAGCLNVLGIGAFARADHATASEAFEASAEIWRTLGNNVELSRQLGNLGAIEVERDDLDRASMFFGEAARAAKEAGDDREEIAALGNLGVIYAQRGEHERAVEAFELAASSAARVNDEDSRAWALSNLGSVQEELGRYEAAGTALGEALCLLDRLGWTEGVVYTLSGLARVALALGEHARAVELLSAAERLGGSIGLEWQREEAARRDTIVSALRDALGSDFETKWTEADALPTEDVVARESRPVVTTDAGA